MQNSSGTFINHVRTVEVGCQMTIILHKPCLSDYECGGRGASKMPRNLSTWFMDDPLPAVEVSAPDHSR